MEKKIQNIRIGLYPFELEFVNRDDIKGCDGRCFHNDRRLAIADDMDEVATILVIRHEVVHALLGTQGRAYQTKFGVEEMCEFVAYRLPEINEIMEYIENSLHQPQLTENDFKKLVRV